MDQVTRRQDRVTADVQCLMCGRLIGELFGLVWRADPGRRTARSLAHLTTFRSAVPGAPTVLASLGQRLRCQHCGGVGMIEEVSTVPEDENVPPDEVCPVHGDDRPRLGRPPRGCLCSLARAAA